MTLSSGVFDADTVGGSLTSRYRLANVLKPRSSDKTADIELDPTFAMRTYPSDCKWKLTYF